MVVWALLFLDKSSGQRLEIPTRETMTDRDNDRRLDCGTLCSSLISSTVAGVTAVRHNSDSRRQGNEHREWTEMGESENRDPNLLDLNVSMRSDFGMRFGPVCVTGYS